MALCCPPKEVRLALMLLIFGVTSEKVTSEKPAPTGAGLGGLLKKVQINYSAFM